MREPNIVTEADEHVHFNSDQLLEPMVIPFYDGDNNSSTVACVPAKQVTGLLDLTEGQPPTGIIAMSVGHMGVASGYNSDTLGRLLTSLIAMREQLITLEKEYAEKL